MTRSLRCLIGRHAFRADFDAETKEPGRTCTRCGRRRVRLVDATNPPRNAGTMPTTGGFVGM